MYKSHYENVPFEIPESWAWCRLLDVCHIFGRIGFRGYTKEDLVHSGGAITLSPSNIVNGRMSYDNCTYISWDKYKESPEIQISNNDILLVKTGSSYGKCALVTDLPQAATINPQFVVLKYISYNAALLRYVLQSNYAKSNYERFVLGTAIPTFTQVVLGDMLIPLPPANEQIKIIKEIDRWFAIIDEIESGTIELESYVKQTKSKILDLAISGKLVPQDPNDEPAIELLKRINPGFEPCDNSHYENLPQGWVVCRLEDVCQICDNQRQPINSTERQERKKRAQTLYPYYGATGQVDWIDDYMLDGTFILLGEDGAPFLEKFADKAYVVSGKIWVNNHAHILKPNCDITYLTYYLNRYDYSKCVNGSTRLKLTQADMKNMTIVLPPLAEQHRIAGRIENIFRMLDAITAEL